MDGLQKYVNLEMMCTLFFLTAPGFYSPIFKTYQQKDISGFLTTMWQNDPFKAKWSILAKAYSIIRENNTKNAAPLDKFLSLTCPLIGIVPRDEYLGVMGWSIVDTAGVKNMERLFTPEISSFPESFLMTNLSAEDIVAHCYQVSYIQHNTNDIARNPGATATLTMAAQPTSNSTQPTFMSTQPAALPTQSPSSSSSPVELNFAATEPQQDQQDGHDFFVANSVHGNFDVQDVLTHNNNGAVGASGVVRQTVHDLSGQQFPFMDEFDPFSTSALDFDPFNMSQDAAFASNSVGTYLAPGSSEFPEAFNIDDLLSSELFDMTE